MTDREKDLLTYHMCDMDLRPERYVNAEIIEFLGCVHNQTVPAGPFRHGRSSSQDGAVVSNPGVLTACQYHLTRTLIRSGLRHTHVRPHTHTRARTHIM